MRLQRDTDHYPKAATKTNKPYAPLPASLSRLGFLLQLTQKLQSSLDLEQQLKIFFYSIQFNVPVDGLAFTTNANAKVIIEIGKAERNRTHYKLVVENQEIGELTLSRKQKFLLSELIELESLISLLAFPVRNALQYHQAITHATTDSLTGTGNRTHLNDTLHRELKLTKRHHYNLSMLLIDVDYFKSINDSYGHQAGDKALKTIVDGIQAMTRDTDRIFRYGGDEFVVLLDNTDEARARLVGERIRMHIEHTTQQSGLPLSVTIGTATLLPADTQETLFARADSALYRAKERGRNCVETSVNVCDLLTCPEACV